MHPEDFGQLFLDRFFEKAPFIPTVDIATKLVHCAVALYKLERIEEPPTPVYDPPLEAARYRDALANYNRKVSDPNTIPDMVRTIVDFRAAFYK